MVITSRVRVRGWLPAGMILNTRLDRKSLIPNGALLVPVINAGKSLAPFVGFQASDDTALAAVGQFLTDVAAFALDGVASLGAPLMLARNTYFDGEIVSYTGEDTPKIALSVLSDRPAVHYSYYTAEHPDVVDLRLQLFVVSTCRRAMLLLDPNHVLHDAMLPVTYTQPGATEATAAHIMGIATFESRAREGMGRVYTSQSPATDAYTVLLRRITGSLVTGAKCVAADPSAVNAISWATPYIYNDSCELTVGVNTMSGLHAFTHVGTLVDIPTPDVVATGN